jgi:hypothetical protein
MDATASAFPAFCTEYNAPSAAKYNGAWIGKYGGNPYYFTSGIGDGGSISYGNGRLNMISSVQLQTNNWYYFITIFEGPSNRKMYINCIQDNNCNFDGSASTYVKNLSLHGSIGRLYTGSAVNNAKGYIDEVAIWNRALDTDEILQLCETDIWQIMQMKVETNESQGFSIFPNPMTTKTEIYFPNPNKEMHTIKVYSISGQEIVSWENINTEVFSIERGNLANGMYIVELYNTLTNRSIFEKLIIQ